MGIYNNGYRLGNSPFKYRCGALTTIYNPSTMTPRTTGGTIRGIQYSTGTLTALPQGSNVPGTWMLPQKAGGMSSHNEAQGVASGSLSMQSGMNIAGLAEGTTPTAEATLQLVVSMIASALGEAAASGNINAALGLSGNSAGSCTAQALINALAWAIGQSNGEATATLVRYATGELKGSITPFTELSPEGLAAAVWNSLVTQYQEDGTMGKALGTASSGGVDLNLMAQAVWEYVTRSVNQTTDANITQVNGVAVTGTGTELDPWGP